MTCGGGANMRVVGSLTGQLMHTIATVAANDEQGLQGAMVSNVRVQCVMFAFAVQNSWAPSGGAVAANTAGNDGSTTGSTIAG